MTALPDFAHSLFVEGPAGSGKTTSAVQYIKQLTAENAIPLDSILVLVPHPVLGLPYSRIQSLAAPPEVITLSKLARMAIKAFWPVAASALGLDANSIQPTFLSTDMAQFHLSRFAQPYWELGIFDGIRLPKYRVVNQIIDSVNNAVLAGFTLDDAETRLITAWGDRHSSRIRIYQTAMEIAHQYQEFCRKNALLDYALQNHLFVNVLLDHPDFQDSFRREFRYFVAENVEEMGALTHDFIFWCTETVERTLIIYDHSAGFRTFLGADPANAYLLRDVCHQRMIMNEPVSLSPSIQELTKAVHTFFHPPPTPPDEPDVIDTRAVQVTTSTFYPQMIEHCVQQVKHLVSQEHVPPEQIAIVSPYMHDALLFALQSRLTLHGIPSNYHRPSRPLKSEPSVQMLLILMRLSCPELNSPPSVSEVAQALGFAINSLDPLRASLLSQSVYRQNALVAIETISPDLIERITPSAAQQYEDLRQWLNDHASTVAVSPDHFIKQMVSDVLSKPGFCFHQSPEATYTAEEFIAVAHRFCNSQAVYEPEKAIIHEFFQFAVSGFTSSDWQAEQTNTVSISPAHTYLTRNIVVDYQFWLDTGDSGWHERLEQPLTHPYVLRRNFPPDAIWTDEMEQEAQNAGLQNVILGLLRRCRKGVFIEICDISASGYEQHGLLLLLLQQIFNEIPVTHSS